MSGHESGRHGERPERSGAQTFALVLAILFFAQAAVGIYLIYTGVAEWMGSGPHYDPTIKPLGTSFEISLGTFALTGLVPGALLSLLFARATKARLRANVIGVAFVWLVLFVFGLLVGAWQGGLHLGIVVLAVLPALYTACVVAYVRGMRSGTDGGAV
jgi:hypothetical protein